MGSCLNPPSTSLGNQGAGAREVLGLLPDRQISRTVRAAADIESDGNADVHRRSSSGELNHLGDVKMDRRDVPREGVLARVRHQRAPVGADPSRYLECRTYQRGSRLSPTTRSLIASRKTDPETTTRAPDRCKSPNRAVAVRWVSHNNRSYHVTPWHPAHFHSSGPHTARRHRRPDVITDWAAFSSQSVITFGAAMAASGVRARTVDVSRMPRRDMVTPVVVRNPTHGDGTVRHLHLLVLCP